MELIPLYDLRGVSRSYGSGATRVTAVDGVDLRIARGEFLVVAGPSGSGKTTLLQLLGALDRPTAGEVAFEGSPLARMGDGELARLRRDTLGFIFQQFNLIPTLTAAQNVEVPLAAAGLRPAQRRARTAELLERVGLGRRARHLPSQLSGGEQQRVAIARALANEPDVVLADEPTGNLDSATGGEIVALLHELWRDGLSVVLITHDPAIASGASRVVRLRDGRIAEAEESKASDNEPVTRILVVDDEPAVRAVLERALRLDAYEVELAEDGRGALDRLALSPPDVVVLDVLMPHVDGLEVCRRLRAAGDRTPVLMLTARDAVDDRVAGLDAGADDYLVKPFALKELQARVRALLRRARAAEERGELRFADLRLEPESWQARRGARRLELSRTEFNLLALFLDRPRQVFTRTEIFERVWGYDFGPSSNALGVYIGYLRRKLEAGGEPRLLHTVRGVGYVLREP